MEERRGNELVEVMRVDTALSGVNTPLAATSVAISSGTLPALNSSSADVRSCCDLSPWMAVTL
jgi:hypothetical protein